MPAEAPRSSGKPASREQRQRAARKERQAARRAPQHHWLPWAILAAGVLVVAAILAAAKHGGAATVPGEVAQSPSAAGQHVAPGTLIQYQYSPPSSGPHYPAPASWTTAKDTIPPGTWVHNLEHGGIVLLYDPARVTPAQQKQLAGLFQQVPNDPSFQEHKLVVTPYPKLDHLIRVQAWGWTLPLDSVNANVIVAFYQEHVDKGPEQVP